MRKVWLKPVEQKMKTIKCLLWLAFFGILLAGLVAGPDLWAAPGQYPARQTVPTRTPEAPVTPEPTSPPPKPKPKEPSPTAPPEVTPTVPLVPAEATASASTPLLPGAGGCAVRLPLAVATIVAGVFVLVAVGRRT